MDTAQIAALLEPFLTAPIPTSREDTPPAHCHSESGQRPGEACPERSRREPAVPSPADDRRLTTDDLHHISTYIDLLQRWNSRINLTAIRTPQEIVTRHFGESLFAARCLFLNSSASSAPSALKAVEVADIGSGPGFPGIPIKLWAPDIHLTLIESNHKKAAFLREVARALTLTNVNVQTARAEDLAQSRQDAATPPAFDVVTLRAVERFDAILSVAGSLVAPRGRLALLISSAQALSGRLSMPDLAHPFAWSNPFAIPLSKSRMVVIGTRAP